VGLAITSWQTGKGNIKGSIPWAAPEVVVDNTYGKRADIWSFGCTILEMATAKEPWSEANLDNPIAYVLKIGDSN
jgi:serine/threonine protein kinase